VLQAGQPVWRCRRRTGMQELLRSGEGRTMEVLEGKHEQKSTPCYGACKCWWAWLRHYRGSIVSVDEHIGNACTEPGFSYSPRLVTY